MRMQWEDSQPIQDLEMSVRSVGSLKHAGIHTIGQLLEWWKLNPIADHTKVLGFRRYYKEVGEVVTTLLAERIANLAETGTNKNTLCMTHQHKKRGTEYHVLGVGEIQSKLPLKEGDLLVVYIGENGRIWLRPPEEAYDGRFIKL